MTDKNVFTVLIVDDHQVARKGLAALLASFRRGKPHPVRIEVVGEAGNGEQAIQQAIVLKPDLIFMDIEMPGVDGLEAARAIKHELSGTCIIVVSMHSGKREAALAAGADEFLPKGTDPRIFREVVLRALHLTP